MLKLNLKIALRNLLKNKAYAAINIIGLAFGLTAFVLLLLFVNYQETFETWNKDLENVFKVREHHSFFTPDNKEHWQDMNESRVSAILKSKVPQVQFTTKIDPNWGQNQSVKLDGADAILMNGIRDADTAFFKVFPFRFIHGDQLTALDMPNTVVVKKSLAIKLFGTDKVLGKTFKVMRWRTDPGSLLTITGVVDDVQSPTDIEFTAITHMGWRDKDPEQPQSSNFCLVYARLADHADLNLVNKNAEAAYIAFKKENLAARKSSFEEYIKSGNKPGLKLISVKQAHKEPPFTISWVEKLKPVFAIAAFLLLVSIINFINLATAQSVQRAKEVGVKKVLGSYKKQLIGQFLIESAVQSILALFLCVVLVELMIPSFNESFDVSVTFWRNAQLEWVLLQLITVFAMVTLLAGFYPAWVLANYDPVSVLKGNYGSSLKGVALRNVLVVFQFIISVTFLISIGVMQMQSTYMNDKDLGFERSHLVNINTNYDEGFAERIKRIHNVQFVGTTTQVMGNAFNVPREIVYKGKKINVNAVSVSIDALSALGVKVVSGRVFSPEYKQDTVNTVVLNEAAANLLDKHMVGSDNSTIKMGDYTFTVVGVIKNYHNEGFDKEVLPTLYKATELGGTSNTNNMLVKFKTGNYTAALKEIEKEWKVLYPDFPMKYETLDDAFQKTLKENQQFMQLVMVFSMLSVGLSLLGLFALSTFVAKRRTREVAVRKVLGASTAQIIHMLNRSFLLLVCAANIVSWPIAYIIIQKWLSGFSYRIEMPFIPFLSATVISILIALITVSFQARKSALQNPVDALKYE